MSGTDVAAAAVAWTKRVPRHVWSWLAAAAIVSLVALSVPWQQDEFLMYHVLACWNPAQTVNSYSAGCLNWPIELGPIGFQRSYAYVGMASSLALAPFWLVLPSLVTPFIVGALALVLIVAGLARSLGLPSRMLPPLLMFFPLTFTVLHDSGPVRIGLVVLSWTPYAVGRFLDAPRHLEKAGWAVGIAVAWMVAVEDKPFFLFLIPGSVAFALGCLLARHGPAELKRRWRSLAALLVGSVVAASSVVLLLTVEGQPYLEHLRAGTAREVYQGPMRSGLAAGTFLTFDWPYYAHRVLVDALRNPLASDTGQEITQRLPHVNSATSALALVLTVVIIIAVLVLLSWAVVRGLRAPTRSGRASTLTMLTSFGLLWGSAFAAGGWANHHFVYAQLPLLGIVATAFAGSHGTRRMGITFGVLSAASLLVIWVLPTQPAASRQIDTVMRAAIANSDASTVINCGSWGCYYPYSLLSANSVPVLAAESPEDAARLEQAASDDHLRIVHVCQGCDLWSVQSLFRKSAVRQIGTDTTEWSAFSVDPPTAPLG